jgi:hypothetical protein
MVKDKHNLHMLEINNNNNSFQMMPFLLSTIKMAWTKEKIDPRPNKLNIAKLQLALVRDQCNKIMVPNYHKD